MSVLTVDNLAAGYQDFQAVFDISLELQEGRLLALVGANGAGKTSVLRAIAGVLRPWEGTIRFGGKDVTAVPDHQRARLGIGLVPEGRHLFPTLTVEENLLVGAATKRPGPWNLQSVYEMLPLLRDRRRRPAARLSGGEQQAVAIGRALMGNPKLLLLDEVSLGLAPLVVDQIYQAVPAIRSSGTSILLVEQDLNRTLTVADDIVCILEGRVVLSGTSQGLSREAITEAYFGSARSLARKAQP